MYPLKLLLFSACGLLFKVSLIGQVNLVPNPSFEDTLFCPTSGDQVSLAIGWENFSDQTPDYFNACSSSSDVDVPSNWGGFQPASSGSAYCALSAFYPVASNKREIIGSSLSENMLIGTKYYFSMKVNLSIDSYISSSYACNKLGVRFSTVPYSDSNPAPINNEAHIWSDSIITDTLNWTTIFGSFTADSVYCYLALGNFFDDPNTDTIKVASGTPSFVFAYYYIDDICVSTDSSYAASYVYTGTEEISLEDKISIFPNPANNQITIDLSNADGNSTAIIFNSLGQLISKTSLSNSDNNVIHVQNLTNGIYTLQVNTKNSIFQQKLIINH